MLSSILPLALIIALVCPVHFSITVPEFILIIAFVIVSRGPSKSTKTMFLVIVVHTFIFISISCVFFPDTLSLPETSLEIALEIAAIGPVVLPIALRFPLIIESFIKISIVEAFDSLAMLEPVLELPLISIPIDPGVDPIAMRGSLGPLPDVGVALGTQPHACALFEALEPFTLIELAVGPSVLASAWR